MANDNIQAQIVVADDNPQNLELLSNLLSMENFQVIEAEDGEEALRKIDPNQTDLIILDIMMPKMDGYEACRRLKERPETRFIPVILLTALDDLSNRIKGFEVNAEDYLVKPFNRFELIARVKSLIKMRRLVKMLDDAESVIFSLAKAVEAKDSYTEGHIERVSNFAVSLGRELNLSKAETFALRRGGILHDVGKIGIRDSILNKPGRLTDQERDEMTKHPVIGEQICSPLRSMDRALLAIIRGHHEKLDGTGYPDKLRAEEISVVTRIMSIVDVYDALTSDRPYRKGMTSERAFEILYIESKKGWWDTEILDKFSQLINGS